VIKALDGYKRILMLLVFAAGSVASSMTGQSYDHVIKSLLGLIGWDPADAVVSATIVAQLVAAAWAIMDGLKKTPAK
jgi:hypothetical protein